jgi:hypothetical protein
MKARGVFYFGRFFIMGVAFLALFTYVVMILWNWLVPELFSGPIVTYWQTLGILLLSKILLTGVIGHRPKDVPPWRSRDHHWSHRHPSSYWRKKFEEKMNGKVTGEQGQGEGANDGCC